MKRLISNVFCNRRVDALDIPLNTTDDPLVTLEEGIIRQEQHVTLEDRKLKPEPVIAFQDGDEKDEVDENKKRVKFDHLLVSQLTVVIIRHMMSYHHQNNTF